MLLSGCSIGKPKPTIDPHEGQVYLYDGYDWVWYTPVEGVETEETGQPREGTETAGTILKADPKQGLLVRAGEGALRIVRLQAPGGKVMDARDYLRGHRMEAGTLIVPERVDG